MNGPVIILGALTATLAFMWGWRAADRWLDRRAQQQAADAEWAAVMRAVNTTHPSRRQS